MSLDHIGCKVLPVIFLALVHGVGALAQAVPDAHEEHLSFSIGVGASSYDLDWGHSNALRVIGPTLWVDWFPAMLQRRLNGLGIEMTARDLHYNTSPTQRNIRTDTLGGGAVYRWDHFRNFQPYAKAEWSLGNIDYPKPATHETRTVSSYGGGFNYRLYDALWLRADEEYQVWPDIFDRHGKSLCPQGITLGVVYGFNSRHHHS